MPDSSYGKLWYPDGFRAARETPLRSSTETPRTALRMVSIATWGGASITRLERHADTWWLIQKAVDEKEPRPRLSYNDSARVPTEQATALVALAAASDYWTHPPQSCRQGLDGYDVILEARVGTAYSAVDCWVPQEPGAAAVVATVRALDALYERVFRNSGRDDR
ncbi:MAG TPA: hypothetical protein VFD27_15170 [Chthoniobacteraceae bacterium]|nr:hypothetical protein [Chthoniobacteraceae bacterium]